MPDFGAIADAIAARYTDAVVVQPAGADPIRDSTANLPNALGALPTVLVFPDLGTFEQGNGTRLGGSDWLVRLYYSELASGDLERDTAILLDYLTVLADQHRTLATLGGTVTIVRTMGWRVGVLKYAGKLFAGLELRVHAVTTEGWPVSA